MLLLGKYVTQSEYVHSLFNIVHLMLICSIILFIMQVEVVLWLKEILAVALWGNRCASAVRVCVLQLNL